MTEATTSPDLLTPKQAAAALRVSRQMMYKLAWQRRIPFAGLNSERGTGRRWRGQPLAFKAEDVEALRVLRGATGGLIRSKLEMGISKARQGYTGRGGARQPPGGAKPKFTSDEVIRIRLLFSKLTISAIARRFKASPSTISKVVNGQRPYLEEAS